MLENKGHQRSPRMKLDGNTPHLDPSEDTHREYVIVVEDKALLPATEMWTKASSF